MSDTIEVTQVVETTGEKPFLTVMGSFLVIPDPTMEKGHRRFEGKNAYVNPEDYEQLKNMEAQALIMTIKAYKKPSN